MVGIVYENLGKIDEKDKLILKTLFKDGRMSIADLSKNTSLRRDSIARRLKRLKKENVVTGFIPIINPAALSYPNIAMFLLGLKIGNETDKINFLRSLVANKFIVHVSRLIGKFDFYCAVIYENTNHLNSIVEEIKKYIPNIIEDFEIYQVVNDPKYEKMDDLL